MSKGLAQTISNLFHPLLTLTYVALILCIATPLSILPIKFQTFFVGIVAFYTLLMPLFIIALMHIFHVVKHWALRDRRDRTIPLFANFVCYVVNAVVLTRYGYFPSWVLLAFYGSTLIAFVAWIVSFWWKISAHAAANAAGATYSFILFLFYPEVFPLWLCFVYIIVCGLVCSTRVYLERHDLAQVGAGSLLGVASILLTYFVLI